MLHIDKETRSKVNLLTDGAYKYATDLSTEVTMAAFAFDDGEPEIWIPGHFSFSKPAVAALKKRGHIVHTIFPDSIKHYIKSGGMIAAHNAQFERLMFWYVLCEHFDIPEPEINQFYCTATQARLNNMPAALGDCARALGTFETKDKRGTELIKLLCIPNDKGEFLEDVEYYIEFAEYCLQDVKTERAISEVMRPMTENELEDYEVNEIINDAGLMIDFDLASAAVNYADAEQADLLKQIHDLTLGKIKKARGKFLTNWIYEHLTEEQQSHMHKYKDGEQKRSLDRTARARILNDPSVKPLVREVVEASDFAQASSTGKFKAMVNRCDPDDHRVCGAYIHAGAAATQRYSSRGLQTHNMPRDGLTNPDDVRGAMIGGCGPKSLEVISGHNVMQTLKRMLRFSIKAAPGKTFVCGDLSQIEGRGLPWLAQGDNTLMTELARAKLDLYANQDKNHDVYCIQAESIYNTVVIRDGSEINEKRRLIGKISELALQFGGGAGALMNMALAYGVHLNEKEAEIIKVAWRQANPWAQMFWKELHGAAINAVRHPLTEFKAGRISYCYQPDINRGSLWCLLPSGNVLCYPHAKIEIVDGRYGPQAVLSAMKANWKPKQGEKNWPRNTLWNGLLTENAAQAVCAVILREILAELVLDLKAPVVGHTHDEVLTECDVNDEDYWKEELMRTMVTPPDWANGLPLDADIWTGPNYRK